MNIIYAALINLFETNPLDHISCFELLYGIFIVIVIMK